MRLRVALAPLALLALVVSTSTGCSKVSHPAAPAGPARPLTVVGDSLSVLGRAPIRAALGAAGWDVLIDAFPGRTTADQIPALTYAAGDPRRAVIIELGTNDAVQVAEGRLDQATVLATIGQALDLFPDQCVVWVVPGRDPQGEGARVGAAIGEELAAQAEHRPNLHLADFGAVLDEHPEYLLDDQVHLTDDGSRALAALMARAAAPCRR
ncbi:MAG: GDSL-type esterase/lipase family protein [Acidimicrobiales bacterium]